MSYEVRLAQGAQAQLDSAIDWLIDTGDERSARNMRKAYLELIEVLESNPQQFRPLSSKRKDIRIGKTLWLYTVCRVDEDAKVVGILSFRHERSDPEVLYADANKPLPQ